MKTKSELQALAERNGWTPRTLTRADVSRMSAGELSYHEACNTANLAKALEPAKHESPTAPESEKQRRIATEFFSLHPQVILTGQAGADNATAFDEALAALEQPTFTIRDFQRVFEKLALQGALILDATACGGGDETEVTGHGLRNHRNLWKLLEPVKPETEADVDAKLSADEYRKAHPEAFADDTVPEFVMQRYRIAVGTFIAQHPEFIPSEEAQEKILAWLKENHRQLDLPSLNDAFSQLYAAGEIGRNPEAVVRSGATTLTTLEPESRTPPQPTKWSFREKLRHMTSTDFAERIATDADFRAAVDALG